jgi:hypothetical protein
MASLKPGADGKALAGDPTAKPWLVIRVSLGSFTKNTANVAARGMITTRVSA